VSYDSGIYELLRGCTVKVTSRDLGKSGSGFFVAPGLIATCAHVVSKKNKASRQAEPANNVVIRQDGREWTAKVRLSSVNPEVDVALLEIDPQDDCISEYVCWGDIPESGNDFYSFGFPIFDSAGNEIPANEMRGEAVTVEYEGVQQIGEGDKKLHFQKFKGGQVIGGSSGAPLLNKNTGRVCGIVKRTRDDLSDLGGTGIPISYLIDSFPELKPFQLEETARWKQCRENEIRLRHHNQEVDTKRRYALGTVIRGMYLFVLFSLVIYWTVVGFQSRDIANTVFSESGLLRDQTIFRVLNYDPQIQLQERLSESRLFANFSLRKFEELVSLRVIPLSVTQTPFYKEPYNQDKYVLRFSEDWYLKPGLKSYGDQIQVRQDTAEYSDEFATQNKCLEEYRRRQWDGEDSRYIRVPAPPFRSIGFLIPQEACWLFLDSFPRGASFSELLDRANRILEWKETVFLIAKNVSYRAQLTGGRTVSHSIYDYFQREDIYNALFSSDCSSHSCIAHGNVGKVRRVIEDKRAPRTAVGTADSFVLDSQVSTTRPIEDLSLSFWLTPWPERMPEPFSYIELQRLESLRNVPMRVRVVDGDLSKYQFMKLAWTTVGRYTKLPPFGANIDTFVVFIAVLIVACMDCVMLLHSKLRMLFRKIN